MLPKKHSSKRSNFFENFDNFHWTPPNQETTAMSDSLTEGTSMCHAAINTIPFEQKDNSGAEINVVPLDNDYINASGDEVAFSSTFSQTWYQRSRRSMIVKYKDLGDDTYTCNHCNTSFWLNESLKQKIKNQLVYTKCCHKGKVRLLLSSPTPAILEQLLNPVNGIESRLFRENI